MRGNSFNGDSVFFVSGGIFFVGKLFFEVFNGFVKIYMLVVSVKYGCGGI